MPLNISRKSSSLFLAGAATVVLLGASFGIASTQFEQVPQTEERKTEKVRVGTYEPQQVFQSSPYAMQLQERVGALQREAQQAQEEGDHQRAMQIQGRMQQVQNEVVQEFLADVEQALPKLAGEAGVQIVALQVVWTDREIGEPRDLSHDLIAHLTGEADDDERAPSPFLPPGQ